MKNLHVFLVKPEECQLVEGLFNLSRVELNDWDKTKVFNFKEHDIVIYNIVCEDETYESIDNIIRDSRRSSN